MPYQIRGLSPLSFTAQAALEAKMARKYRLIQTSPDLLDGVGIGYHEDPRDSDVVNLETGEHRPRTRKGKLVAGVKSKDFVKNAPDVDPEHDPIYWGYIAAGWGRALVGATLGLAAWLWSRYGPADYEEFADLPRCEAGPHDHQDDESYWNNDGVFGGWSEGAREMRDRGRA